MIQPPNRRDATDLVLGVIVLLVAISSAAGGWAWMALCGGILGAGLIMGALADYRHYVLGPRA